MSNITLKLHYLNLKNPEKSHMKIPKHLIHPRTTKNLAALQFPHPPYLLFVCPVEQVTSSSKQEWRPSPRASAVQLLARIMPAAVGGVWHLWDQPSRLLFLFVHLLHRASRVWPPRFSPSPNWLYVLTPDSPLSNLFHSSLLLQVLL